MTAERHEDPYSRVDYRRMIAWPARIEREAPLLREVLGTAPAASVLDLGCGTGEHAEFLAGQGFRTVGIDRSEAQIANARSYEGRHGEAGPRFVLGDFSRLDEHTDERFGAAIWLGNGLPHLEAGELAATLGGLARRLVSGGVLLLQLLNYERIRRQGIRHLPLNFRDDPEGSGEIVFLRLMTLDGPRHVRFNPMSLALRPGTEPPVELKSVREVRLRTWTAPELEAALAGAGFEVRSLHGDMTGGDYRAESSSDLVMTAARRSAVS
jgi:SAM-dependent methyltransferase